MYTVKSTFINLGVVCHIIRYYLGRYTQLRWSLLTLSNGIKDKLNCRHIKYPDPIESLILGFIQFDNHPLIIVPVKSQITKVVGYNSLFIFFVFIYVFGAVLDKCHIDEKNFLLSRFDKICKSTSLKRTMAHELRSFYHEIKTFFVLFHDGMILKYLVEKNKIPKGLSPTEAVFCLNNQEFQIECKSVSTHSGHPIAMGEANTFFDLLKSDAIYKDLYPNNSDYCIELIFDKKLSSQDDGYSAEFLLEKLKDGCIKLKKFNKVRFLSPSEDRQKFSKTFRWGNFRHQVILTSSFQNEWFDFLVDKIQKTYKKKEKRSINLPILYSFEIYGPSVIDGQYDIFFFSNEIELENKGKMSNIYQVPWIEIISRRLIKSGCIVKAV